MTKVLSLIHYPAFGGPHNRNMVLTPVLRLSGVELIIAVPDEPGNSVGRLRAGGATVEVVPLHRVRETADIRTQWDFVKSVGREVRLLEELIRELNIDIVQINGLVNPHGARAARRAGVPVVWQILDTRTPNSVRRVLEPIVHHYADVVMVVGGDNESAMFMPKASLQGRVISFFPPVDTTRFQPDPERRKRARLELGFSDEDFVIGSVSNLNPQKGYGGFIRTLGMLRGQNPAVRGCILGATSVAHSEYAEALNELAEEVGLSKDGSLRIVDPEDRVPDLIGAFDLFVRSSVPRSEGVSTSILEAMAAGLPVVSTDVGRTSDVVDDGVTGLLIRPEDDQSLADGISRLMADEDLRHSMSVVARERAVERYDIRFCAAAHLEAYSIAVGRSRVRRAAFEFRSVETGTRVQAAGEIPLACPACHTRLGNPSDGMYSCISCGRGYPVVDGIPVLLLEPEAGNQDELHDHNHSRGHNHKDEQAGYYDEQVACDFEIQRPVGAAPLYRWMLGEKLRRSTEGLERRLEGASALVVCGGSGMDAHFLSLSGARVVVCDISLGATKRAVSRANRFDLYMRPVVADVEHLPFEDKMFDIVYVHDGLHHLEDPAVGLMEMARVSREFVSMTEPARALATTVAIRLGLALDREDAGNRVARLTRSGVETVLSSAGFKVLRSSRYAMYYPHEPGTTFEFLSNPRVLPLATNGWRLANGVVQRGGNKLSVVATR
jgi:glycosyltransferase involved in cell wall biosynthesis/SAM-dependent methyltransferase